MILHERLRYDIEVKCMLGMEWMDDERKMVVL